MTNPSNRYEDLVPTRHEKAAEVTDTDVNEALERGDLDTEDLTGREIRHDEGAPPYARRSDAPANPDSDMEAAKAARGGKTGNAPRDDEAASPAGDDEAPS